MVRFRQLDLVIDAADMARLYNYTVAKPITAELAREWWTICEGETRVTMLAINESRQVIGYWDINRSTWMKPGYFYVKVIVAPEERGNGLGKQMYEHALSVARGYGATHFRSSVGESDTISLKFAVKRGFEIEYHTYESTLDLTNFDGRRFDDLMGRKHAEGFRFFSLAEAGLTDENKHRFYELNRAAVLDNPDYDKDFPDFHAFSRNVFEGAWFDAEAQIIASYENRWVGLAAIGIHSTDSHAYNTFTGVLREYRGRGLAQALKLQTILLAKQAGVRYIRTHNDSRNRSMLAVNRKLGYRPEMGYFELLCILENVRDADV